MMRSRPEEFEFADSDDRVLSDRVAELQSSGAGWINISPVIAPDDEPDPPGILAMFGGSVHKVPIATWLPGRRLPDGGTKPTTLGLQHAAGPRLRAQLRELDVPIPEGWRVTQDHPRRGLVVQVGSGTPDADGIAWLLRVAAKICAIPTTGGWKASVHRSEGVKPC
jgi:hypothetical protein